MTVGTDLMAEGKLKVYYTTGKIQWNDVNILMKQSGTVSDPKMTQTIYVMSKESSMIRISEE